MQRIEKNSLIILMILSDAKLVAKYIEELKNLKVLFNTPETAEIPDSLLTAITTLCLYNDDLRKDFYTVMHKVGEKYIKIITQKINDL